MAIYEADKAMVVDIVGADAAKIVNNLTTNKMLDMTPGESCETFVTNIKGWCVAHCIAVRTENGLSLIGFHPDPSSVAAHIDRYIISEDAEVTDRSAEWRLIFSDRESELSFATHVATAAVLAADGSLGLCPRDMKSPEMIETAEFDGIRANNLWPIMGVDISDKTIPQEADRDDSAISFTKGCYLGQETIARLDARGRLQRKLCRLKMEQAVERDSDLLLGEKSVGKLSTVGVFEGQHVGLAMLKRGAFEIGTELTSEDGAVAYVY